MKTAMEMYEVIKDVVANGKVLEDEAKADVVAFIDNEMEKRERAAEHAKKRAAEKRAAGDELRAAIEGVLTAEPMLINDIIVALDIDDLTPAKVVARMKQLVGLGKVEKYNVRTSDGRTLVGYALPKAEEA